MRGVGPTKQLILIALTTVIGAVAGPPGAADGAVGCWAPPVVAPVVDPFDAPVCPWCAGHRGLEFAPTNGQPVRAVAGGTVSFAGTVVDRRYVSVDLADGRRVTYGWLATIRVREGQRVAAGDRVGTAGRRTMFTVRRDRAYVDPAPWLGRFVRRPWLVPRHGPGREPPPVTLRCAAHGR